MKDILLKLTKGESVPDELIHSALYEMCDRVHSSCDNGCLVYELNGSEVPDTVHDFKKNRGCDCFKNGKAMFEFIRKNS